MSYLTEDFEARIKNLSGEYSKNFYKNLKVRNICKNFALKMYAYLVESMLK